MMPSTCQNKQLQVKVVNFPINAFKKVKETIFRAKISLTKQCNLKGLL